MFKVSTLYAHHLHTLMSKFFFIPVRLPLYSLPRSLFAFARNLWFPSYSHSNHLQFTHVQNNNNRSEMISVSYFNVENFDCWQLIVFVCARTQAMSNQTMCTLCSYLHPQKNCDCCNIYFYFLVDIEQRKSGSEMRNWKALIASSDSTMEQYCNKRCAGHGQPHHSKWNQRPWKCGLNAVYIRFKCKTLQRAIIFIWVIVELEKSHTQISSDQMNEWASERPKRASNTIEVR